jgi:hypothetical protein
VANEFPPRPCDSPLFLEHGNHEQLERVPRKRSFKPFLSARRKCEKAPCSNGCRVVPRQNRFGVSANVTERSVGKRDRASCVEPRVVRGALVEGKADFLGLLQRLDARCHGHSDVRFAVTAILASFHISNADAGLIGTVILLTSAFGEWVAGALADQSGRVRTLQITISSGLRCSRCSAGLHKAINNFCSSAH